ncbi:Uncharacterised protein [Vibrio cholerae]|nr:Uncharacterised protein [Vibrio cholerae]
MVLFTIPQQQGIFWCHNPLCSLLSKLGHLLFEISQITTYLRA